MKGFFSVLWQENVILSFLEGVNNMFGKQEIKSFLEEKIFLLNG